VVGGRDADPRHANDRAALRAAMRELRFGELREGVWVRPDNLDLDRAPDASAVVDAQCRWGSWLPDGDEAELVAELWDLDGWRRAAMDLRRDMDRLVGRLEDHDVDALAPGFVLSATVLRHFQADPLLPDELLPRHWPGVALRRDYDRFDAAYRALLVAWFRTDAATA
jgi:phenylacetic acid degradation operon negative regulatory protein